MRRAASGRGSGPASSSPYGDQRASSPSRGARDVDRAGAARPRSRRRPPSVRAASAPRAGRCVRVAAGRRPVARVDDEQALALDAPRPDRRARPEPHQVLPGLCRDRVRSRRRRTRWPGSSSASPRRRRGRRRDRPGPRRRRRPRRRSRARPPRDCPPRSADSRAASTSRTDSRRVGGGVLRLRGPPPPRTSARPCAAAKPSTNHAPRSGDGRDGVCRRRSRGGRSRAARCRAACRWCRAPRTGSRARTSHVAAGDPQRSRSRQSSRCQSTASPPTGCAPRRAGQARGSRRPARDDTRPAPPSASQRAGDVDPVQQVVGQQHVRHVVERRADQRRQRLVVQVGHPDDGRRSAPSRTQQGRRAPRRCPATVVVDRDPHAGRLGAGQQRRAAASRSAADERQRLLGEHVLAGVDRGLDPVQPSLGPGGEVDEPDLRSRPAAPRRWRRPVPRTGTCRGSSRSWPGSGSRRRSRRRRTARTPGGGRTGRSCPRPGSRRHRGPRGSAARCRAGWLTRLRCRREPQHGLQDSPGRPGRGARRRSRRRRRPRRR